MGLQRRLALGFKLRRGSHLATLFMTTSLFGDHVALAEVGTTGLGREDHMALEVFPFAT